MSRERDFIARLAAFATHPAARGLADDAAVLPFGERELVLTHDMLVEGVHFLPDDTPEDVAWKLVAVNLSDLAAKGARPIGALLGHALGFDAVWDARFADGIGIATARFDLPLLGGDTVSLPSGGPRILGLTAIGEVRSGGAPARCGAKAGDMLYVTGRIGAAGLGLALARSGAGGAADLLAAYRRPMPRLSEGAALAPLVRAMADVSDGLLIDAARMAAASGLAVEISLDQIPFAVGVAEDRLSRLAAATAGDDYELICAASNGLTFPGDALVCLTEIGRFAPGKGLSLRDREGLVPLPGRLGYEHDPH